jgi:hypothetical protein
MKKESCKKDVKPVVCEKEKIKETLALYLKFAITNKA